MTNPTLIQRNGLCGKSSWKLKSNWGLCQKTKKKIGFPEGVKKCFSLVDLNILKFSACFELFAAWHTPNQLVYHFYHGQQSRVWEKESDNA